MTATSTPAPSGLSRSEITQFAGSRPSPSSPSPRRGRASRPSSSSPSPGSPWPAWRTCSASPRSRPARRRGRDSPRCSTPPSGTRAEIIIVVLAIREGGALIDVARASIVGSVLGNVLLILGASLLVCGLRHGRGEFNASVAGVNATMLVLAAAALAHPDALLRRPAAPRPSTCTPVARRRDHHGDPLRGLPRARLPGARTRRTCRARGTARAGRCAWPSSCWPCPRSPRACCRRCWSAPSSRRSRRPASARSSSA